MQKYLQRECLKTAIQKLPRDGSAITTNWDTLTKDETRVLAQGRNQVTAADFLETFSPALSEQNSVAIPAEHELTEFPDWAHFREGFRARHQHQCRVCSI
ncbi:hypothetical protein PC115_g14078 [Phytophthora cactorum]|uniref:Uncharacterized protein n=1 Tax=Phytophthora cactorum TaxID=29920 RepID=A0A8T1BTG8_9STRA|nr:hypothetical protein PC115_g14078 [Phytophthora cactorum]